MLTPVSINRCAENLGLDRKEVLVALDLGVARYGRGEGKLIPRDVFVALQNAGRLDTCPCCGAWLRLPKEDQKQPTEDE